MQDEILFCGECGKDVNEKLYVSDNLSNVGIKKYLNINNYNNYKGIGYILFGIFGFFIFPVIFQEANYSLIRNFRFNFPQIFIVALSVIIRLLSLLLFVYAILLGYKYKLAKQAKLAFKEDSHKNTKLINMENNNVSNTQISFENKVIKVNFVGGLIGLISQNQTLSLNNAILDCNNNGWEVVQVLEDKSKNLLIILFRLLLLVITVFFFTFENGYKVVLRRQK